MLIKATYPGVYVEEIPSGVRPITGVSTADTAFVDFFKRGPVNIATRITSFQDFTRIFGGLDIRSEASYAIQQFFIHGGQIAWVVRVDLNGMSPASKETVGGKRTKWIIKAESAGTWAKDHVWVAIDHKAPSIYPNNFNMMVREVTNQNGNPRVLSSEIYRNLSPDPKDARFARKLVNPVSQLVQLDRPEPVDSTNPPDPPVRPDATGENIGIINTPENRYHELKLAGGSDGDVLEVTGSIKSGKESEFANALKSGMNALDKMAPFNFNILCIPATAKFNYTNENQNRELKNVVSAANEYCKTKRAFFIMDLLPVGVSPKTYRDITKPDFQGVLDTLRHENAALYFPQIQIPDSLNGGTRIVGASGTMAGIYAKTDTTRGVWKAPAGTEAKLVNASIDNRVKLNDLENGVLNQIGINVIRNFPIYSNVSWGARTLKGSDFETSEWKYIPVRRTALFIEESLYQGLKWAVFEPNDEPLWAQIRLNVGAFMHNLFRQGAFQGQTRNEAYFVKCDKETTTQNDINQGIVNVMVGFAPLKPAEFVVIQLQQMAGQILV